MIIVDDVMDAVDTNKLPRKPLNCCHFEIMLAML
jgi:hypothetical protein